MKFEYGHTLRGFPFMKFKDEYQAECSIQFSSSIDASIWLGVDDAKPMIMASDAHRLGLDHLLQEGPERLNGWVAFPVPSEVLLTTRMHLSQEQVKALLPILQHFADHGTFPTLWDWAQE